MRLNGKAFGLACSILWGATVFVATLSVALRGGSGELTSKLGRFYIGYQPTLAGSIVGLIYGFLHAFVFGLIFAGIYNAVVQGEKKQTETK